MFSTVLSYYMIYIGCFTHVRTLLQWIIVYMFYCTSFISHFKSSIQSSWCKGLGFFYFHWGRVFLWTGNSQLFITVPIYFHLGLSIHIPSFLTLWTLLSLIFSYSLVQMFGRGTAEACRTHVVSQSGVSPAEYWFLHNPTNVSCCSLL